MAIYRKPVLDKTGQEMLDNEGNPVYELDEVVVSFFEAVTRVNLGLPVIDKNYNKSEGWQFMFTMKQNEYFVYRRLRKKIICLDIIWKLRLLMISF